MQPKINKKLIFFRVTIRNLFFSVNKLLNFNSAIALDNRRGMREVEKSDSGRRNREIGEVALCEIMKQNKSVLTDFNHVYESQSNNRKPNMFFQSL